MTTATHSALSVFALAGLVGWATTAQAQDSRITQVTVYPGSAMVQRTLQLPAGAQQAVFACLPAGLDNQTLQVIAPPGVNVGELSVRQQPRELLAGCRSPDNERVRTLEDRIAALQAEAQGLEQSASWLARYAQPTAAAHIAATATALQRTGQSVALRQQQITRELAALQAQLEPLQAEHERTAQAGSQASTVHVTLSAPQGGTLQLRYQLRGPGWQPSYRASLDVERQQVRLERTALVAQHTGEDWRDVPLTLSTGQPHAASSGPLPRPWRLSEAVPVQEQVHALAAPKVAAAPAVRAARSMERMGSANAPEPISFDASVLEGMHATTFVLPQRITVPSSGDKVTLSLGTQQLDARVAVRTTPALDASAYLVASFALPEGVWPAGSIALYRDGTYVGQNRLNAADVASIGLGFGRDERVQVRKLPAQKMDSNTGLLGSRQQRVVHSAWEVLNQHRTPIALQVLDAAPIAEQQDIRVESRYAPQPTRTDWNGQPGTVLWEHSLAPGATERFSAEHTISWPQDMHLNERR